MKPYEKMTAAELAKATREFDGGVDLPAVEPPPEELTRHKRALKRGRPRLGAEDAVRVLFTIQPAILRQIDQFTKREGMKRSQFITAAAVAYMQGDTKHAREIKEVRSSRGRGKALSKAS